MLNPNTIKKDFPIFTAHPELAYLDSSSTVQTPEVVLSAMDAYYRGFRANTRSGQYAISQQAGNAYENAREQVAKFFGAKKEEIIFTGGSTAAANLAIYSLENSGIFHEGDEIVTTIMEHHSLFIPLQKLAARKKLTLRFIPLSPKEDFTLDYDVAEKLITEKTKLVAFVGVSNVTGTVHDMKRLCDLAKKHGAYSLIDATQGAGHIAIDVEKIGCDLLFFAGHKMCGPVGIGVLYGKKEVLEKLEPGFYGGGTIEEVTKDTIRFAAIPWKFEAGTPNIAGAIGIGAACEYLSNIGMEEIEEYLLNITKYALEKLSAISDVALFCPRDPKHNAGVISFSIKGIHAHDIVEVLCRENLALRGGHHCAQPLLTSLGEASLTRASLYIYTTKEDIDALCEGIEKVKKVFQTQNHG